MEYGRRRDRGSFWATLRRASRGSSRTRFSAFAWELRQRYTLWSLYLHIIIFIYFLCFLALGAQYFYSKFYNWPSWYGCMFN